jgi:hypothetical protein
VKSRLAAGFMGVFVMAALVMDGCAWFRRPASSPVPFNRALAGLEDDVRRVGFTTVPDFTQQPVLGKDAFEESVRKRQRDYCMPDPTAPVIYKDYSLALQGTFTAGGKFQVSGIPTPTGGAEVDITKAQQQTVTVPIMFVPLSKLPDANLAENLSFISGIPDTYKGDSTSAKYATKSTLIAQYLEQRDALRAEIQHLIATYAGPSAEACAKQEKERKNSPGGYYEMTL